MEHQTTATSTPTIPAGAKITCASCEKQSTVPEGGYPAREEQYLEQGGEVVHGLLPLATVPCPHCGQTQWYLWEKPTSLSDLPLILAVLATIIGVGSFLYFLLGPLLFGQ